MQGFIGGRAGTADKDRAPDLPFQGHRRRVEETPVTFSDQIVPPLQLEHPICKKDQTEQSRQDEHRELPHSLLLLEVNAFVFVAGDGGPNLRWRFAEPGLLVGEEALLGAGGALGAVQAFEATAQAGVAEGAVATAVARELIDDAGDLGHLLVNMDLPGIAEVFAGELAAGEDGRQGADLEGRGGVVRGHIFGGVGPLGVTGRGEGEDGESDKPTAGEEFFHGRSPEDYFNWNQDRKRPRCNSTGRWSGEVRICPGG